MINKPLLVALTITILIYSFIALIIFLSIKIEKKLFHTHYVKKHNPYSRYYKLLDKENNE